MVLELKCPVCGGDMAINPVVGYYHSWTCHASHTKEQVAEKLYGQEKRVEAAGQYQEGLD